MQRAARDTFIAWIGRDARDPRLLLAMHANHRVMEGANGPVKKNPSLYRLCRGVRFVCRSDDDPHHAISNSC